MFISSKVQRSMCVHSQRLCSNVNISTREAARSSLFCAYSALGCQGFFTTIFYHGGAKAGVASSPHCAIRAHHWLYFCVRIRSNWNWNWNRPISQLNSYPLDFDFFVYLLVIEKSSTEEFKLYNPLKHLLVLSIGYSYSAQFIDYSFVDCVCVREPPFRSWR